MNMSFVKEGVEDTTTPVPPAPETPAASTEVATREATPGFFDEDNIRYEDIVFPRINIVQFVGKLATEQGFDPGSILLASQNVIHTPESKTDKGTPPLNLTVIGFRPLQYAEKLPGGKQGLLVNSESEVVKHNGTLSWKEWDASKSSGSPLRYFQTLATALLLVEKPDFYADPDQLDFPYVFEVEGQPSRYFTLALWGMKGSAYTKGAKAIRTQKKIGSLRKGYLTHSWTLTTTKQSKDDNYYFEPKLRASTKNGDLFQEFIKAIIGAQ
jgi:hypothetical protein